NLYRYVWNGPTGRTDPSGLIGFGYKWKFGDGSGKSALPPLPTYIGNALPALTWISVVAGPGVVGANRGRPSGYISTLVTWVAGALPVTNQKLGWMDLFAQTDAMGNYALTLELWVDVGASVPANTASGVFQ